MLGPALGPRVPGERGMLWGSAQVSWLGRGGGAGRWWQLWTRQSRGVVGTLLVGTDLLLLAAPITSPLLLSIYLITMTTHPMLSNTGGGGRAKR